MQVRQERNLEYIRAGGQTDRQTDGQTDTLPRFSDGASSGRMHITPYEKTYLALNNTNTMHLNDIHVEFVNSDETPATDLTDKAMVIFHIKQGKHGGCGCK